MWGTMFWFSSIVVLAYFAWRDYELGLVNVGAWLFLFLVSFFFVFWFQQLGGALPSFLFVLAIMLFLQVLRITFGGDTLVLVLIVLLNPIPLLVLGSLTASFLLVATLNHFRVWKTNQTSFLPTFFVAYSSLTILTQLLLV